MFLCALLALVGGPFFGNQRRQLVERDISKISERAKKFHQKIAEEITSVVCPGGEIRGYKTSL